MSSNWPWTPPRRPEDQDTEIPLAEAVGQSLGAASSCWENLPGAGTFDSTRCGHIHDWLMAYLSDWGDKIRAEANEATLSKLAGSKLAALSSPHLSATLDELSKTYGLRSVMEEIHRKVADRAAE